MYRSDWTKSDVLEFKNIHPTLDEVWSICLHSSCSLPLVTPRDQWKGATGMQANGVKLIYQNVLNRSIGTLCGTMAMVPQSRVDPQAVC